ncbi:hypothetical protein [Paenibacillus sp. Soil724D2]|uniref:hypothetical protein n=1 Tax=Paenibacillus sp. (strain Soil724D2) TaxID=1736392 RepID=UPI00071523DB|nr:hypothetical protein [Paenibacillus sp. Soil724D2]KRE32767.1 sugar ABC transporter substrate-binding protein [Paenibacillus sp. Soil724D2]
MKKTLRVMLSAALTMSVVAGCSTQKVDNKATETPKATTETKAETAKAATNEFGWEVPSKPIEFSYYYADAINPDKTKKNSDLMHKFLLEKFNVNMNKITFDAKKEDKLNLMLASGDYPEVIANMDEATVAKWVAQGKVLELGPTIDKLAPNVKTQLGDLYKTYLTNGKLYALPGYWGSLPIPDFSAHIRYDYWKELGTPKFETPDQYYDVLKKIQEKHPKNDKGEKTYALSGFAPVTEKIVPTLAGMWGLKDGNKISADGKITHWINTPEGLELTLFMNKIYRDGLLDPDTFINKYENMKAKMSTDRVMGFIGAWWIGWNAGHEVWQKSDPNWNEEKRFMQVSAKAATADKAYLSGKNSRSTGMTVITNKAKNPEEIVKWLNYSVTDTGTRLIGWGVPNTDKSVWNFKDGKASFVESQKQAIIDSKFDYDAGDLLGMDMYNLVTSQGITKDDGKSAYWFDQNFNDNAKWKKMMNDNLKDTIYDNTVGDIKIPANDPLAITDKQVKDLLESQWAKAVMSKTEEESRSNYAALKEKLNAAGLDKIEKYKTDEYQRRLKEWK